MYRDDDDTGRYFFHVEDGDVTHSDSTGHELDSIQDAVKRALELADELEEEGSARKCVTIEDENGEEIACVVVANPSVKLSS